MYKEPKPVCEKLLFITGAPAEYIDNYAKLATNAELMKLRKLCSLRSVILASFKTINAEYLNNAAANLSTIQATSRLVSELAACGITLSDEKSSLSRKIMELNALIDSAEIPEIGIPEDWVRKLLSMPSGDTITGIQATLRRFRAFYSCYPYQRYINWSFASMPETQRYKNLFNDDEALYELLRDAYEGHDSQYREFIRNHNGNDIVVVVDCENSDAEKLYATLRIAKEKIKKVILIDDAHTNKLWDELVSTLTEQGITVEHDEVPRLKEQKSLVDLRMVQKTCEEFYKNNVESFILASSDSDLWALIYSIRSANIFVLAEECKCGDAFIDALATAGIQWSYMEDIAMATGELAESAMSKGMAKYIKEQYIDIYRVVIASAKELGVYLPEEEILKYQQMAAESIRLEGTIRDGKLYASI